VRDVAQASEQGRCHAGQKQRTDLKTAKPVRAAEASGNCDADYPTR